MRFFSLVLAADILFSSAVSCDAETLDINRFIGGAFLRYDTAFTVTTTRERWNRMLDNLFLMGKLWEAYGFSPRYKVFRLGAAYHIIDPTGIEGMLQTVDADVNRRTFLANGKLNHWYIPVTLTGRVLFLVRYSDEQGKVVVRLSVYGEGSENRIEQMMLRALAPLLNVYIDRRITRNLRDLNMIITDMERSPDLIRGKIAGIYLEDFNRLVE
jgi:hypothetical protein